MLVITEPWLELSDTTKPPLIATVCTGVNYTYCEEKLFLCILVCKSLCT